MSSDLASVIAMVGIAVERYQAATDDFDRAVARVLGINETDLRCLEIVMQEQPEGATPRLLADRLGVTTGTITTVLDRLEKMNYVTRSPHPTDRRRVTVTATDAATHRAFALIGPLVESGNQILRKHYRRSDLELILDFLERTTELQREHTERVRSLSH